ncbi:hypothetical protein M9H77_32305 [Catharanthus roseus]|uniref:Uncharacterized protein n=1 Tax=Catharanthus roseus TaxID=4058 RepID=A0ACC0A6S1_CATRO|nr:hypothetical protein M9H77_32305 [Catharanthus roseus]
MKIELDLNGRIDILLQITSFIVAAVFILEIMIKDSFINWHLLLLQKYLLKHVSNTKVQSLPMSEILITNQNMGEIKKMQGRLSAWLVKHRLIHRSLGFDYQGIETLQIKFEDWYSIAVILYVYASVYHLTRIEYGVDQPEEVCIKVFVSSVDFQEQESYDMLGISYDNHPRLKCILMPEPFHPSFW